MLFCRDQTQLCPQARRCSSTLRRSPLCLCARWRSTLAATASVQASPAWHRNERRARAVARRLLRFQLPAPPGREQEARRLLSRQRSSARSHQSRRHGAADPAVAMRQVRILAPERPQVLFLVPEEGRPRDREYATRRWAPATQEHQPLAARTARLANHAARCLRRRMAARAVGVGPTAAHLC